MSKKITADDVHVAMEIVEDDKENYSNQQFQKAKDVVSAYLDQLLDDDDDDDDDDND